MFKKSMLPVVRAIDERFAAMPREQIKKIIRQFAKKVKHEMPEGSVFWLRAEMASSGGDWAGITEGLSYSRLQHFLLLLQHKMLVHDYVLGDYPAMDMQINLPLHVGLQAMFNQMVSSITDVHTDFMFAFALMQPDGQICLLTNMTGAEFTATCHWTIEFELDDYENYLFRICQFERKTMPLSKNELTSLYE